MIGTIWDALAVFGAYCLVTLFSFWAWYLIKDFILWRKYRRAFIEQDRLDRQEDERRKRGMR